MEQQQFTETDYRKVFAQHLRQDYRFFKKHGHRFKILLAERLRGYSRAIQEEPITLKTATQIQRCVSWLAYVGYGDHKLPHN